MKVLYTKFSNQRDIKYSIRTSIVEDKHGLKVIKYAESEQSIEHIESFLHCRSAIIGCNPSFQVVNCTIKKNCAVFDYIYGESLTEMLENSLICGDLENVRSILNKYKEAVLSMGSNTLCPDSFGVFVQNFGETDREFLCIPIAHVDLIFDNLIEKNGKLYNIDYEWVFDCPLPVKYVYYRAVKTFYEHCASTARESMAREEMMLYFDISNGETECFEAMEQKFAQKVYPEGSQFRINAQYEQPINKSVR